MAGIKINIEAEGIGPVVPPRIMTARINRHSGEGGTAKEPAGRGKDSAGASGTSSGDLSPEFDFAFDRIAVKKIRKDHGDQKAEVMRGQRAVTAEDYGRLPQMLNDPDRIVGDGLSKVGHPVVRYEKEIGGEIFTAAMEARKQRRTLALQSFWIRPGTPPR